MQSRPTEKSSYREPLLTTAAVAKWLGISTRAVCLWAECKAIPAMKIGRQWRFRQDEVLEWIESPQAAKVKNSTVNHATVEQSSITSNGLPQLRKVPQ